MATPKTAISRFDLSMSFNEFSLELNRQGYIGLSVLPAVTVAKAEANYSKVPIEALLAPVEDTKRAPKGDYKRDDFEWEQASYKTDEHGVEEIVDDAQIEIYGEEIDAEMIARQRAITRLVTPFEVAVANAVFNTTTWTGSALTTGAGTAWTTKASADPVANIDAAKDKVLASCGHPANTLILTDVAFRAMVRTDRVEDLLKYNGGTGPESLIRARQAIADLLDIERIIIARAPMKNTANRAKAVSLARIWDDTKAMVCRIDDTPTLENVTPSIGKTVVFGEQGPTPGSMDSTIGVVFEEYREEARRGSVLRARTNYQVLIQYPQAGHLITGVTA